MKTKQLHIATDQLTHSRSKARVDYLQETDAYNYAIGYFFSGTDFSHKPSGIDAVIPFNQNDLLELYINGFLVVKDFTYDKDTGEVRDHYRAPVEGEVGERAVLRRTGKWWFQRHLLRDRTIYYRSRHDCIARAGYHSYDGARLKLPWADRFGINSTIRRWHNIGWMVLGFDLDAKKGEPDIEPLCDWLLSFFPGAYIEPSTKGKGRHLYVKLAYRVDHAGDRYRTVLLIDQVVTKLSEQLETRRKKLNFKASLDQIRSLPTLFGWCAKKRRVVVVKRYSCIKAPRCSEGMEDIYRFHAAPFVLFDALARLVQQFEAEDRQASQMPLVPDVEVMVQQAYAKTSDEGEPDSEVVVEIIPPPALPLSSNTERTPKMGREEKVAQLRATGNSLLRKKNMVWWQRHEQGKLMSVEQYLELYVGLGLNNGPRDEKMINDMTAVVRYVTREYDEEKTGLGLGGWNDAEAALISIVQERVADELLTWKKERGRVRGIDARYVAAVMFVIGREWKLRSGYITQDQIADRVEMLMGIRLHRNMIQKITNALKQTKLIEMLCRPVWGMGKWNRGTRWKPLY